MQKNSSNDKRLIWQRMLMYLVAATYIFIMFHLLFSQKSLSWIGILVIIPLMIIGLISFMIYVLTKATAQTHEAYVQQGKITNAIVTFILFMIISAIPFFWYVKESLWVDLEKERERKENAQQLQASLKKSVPYFQEKCKGAGIFIYEKNIPRQDSVYIMKPMETKTDKYLPYGDNQYIKHDFFNHPISYSKNINNSIDGEFGRLLNQAPRDQVEVDSVSPSPDFDYIETYLDTPTNLVRFEYTQDPDAPDAYKYERFKLINTPIDFIKSHYGVTWKDISTAEDRAHWVAGGKRQIIDLKTHKVVAEAIGYVMSISPNTVESWNLGKVNTCPADYNVNEFIFSVLRNTDYLATSDTKRDYITIVGAESYVEGGVGEDIYNVKGGGNHTIFDLDANGKILFDDRSFSPMTFGLKYPGEGVWTTTRRSGGTGDFTFTRQGKNLFIKGIIDGKFTSLTVKDFFSQFTESKGVYTGLGLELSTAKEKN